VAQYAVWHGSESQITTLLEAVERNCDCSRTTRCAPHTMLAFDQRALDGLLFVSRLADRLRIEEWRPKEPTLSPR
jgi:hypothetical protein